MMGTRLQIADLVLTDDFECMIWLQTTEKYGVNFLNCGDPDREYFRT